MMTKKFISALALVAVVLGPNAAMATTVSAATITTGLQQDASTPQASAPVVIAKWEMDGPTSALTGTDASCDPNSQIQATGVCGQMKTVSICGIVTDPNGKTDVKHVYGDVYYPNNVRLGNSHIDAETGLPREVSTCGEMVRECTMTPLSNTDAFNLFCTKIRNSNNNLPTFAANYNYGNVCDDAQSGVLPKQTAYVECCDFTMSYEDPNGPYTVNVWANDQSDYNSVPLSNTMTYLASKAFDVDFTGIDYGKVKTGIWQEVPGNTVWATTAGVNGASVRNCSNTRLQIGVWQNDMGIKDPNGTTYATFEGRIGSSSAYATYGPNLLNTDLTHKATMLAKTLDLSELNEMDFGVNVSKFPIQLTGPFSGTMELSAVAADHIACVKSSN